MMRQYEAFDPTEKAIIEETMKTRSPYWSLLGIELVDVKKGWSKIKLPFDTRLVHPFGFAHGGAIFSLADSAVAMALIGLVEPSENFVTVEMKINYLSTFTKGILFAEGAIIHKGRNTALGDTEVRDEKGALVAKASATYMMLQAGRNSLASLQQDKS